jgi:hypothetical protein
MADRDAIKALPIAEPVKEINPPITFERRNATKMSQLIELSDGNYNRFTVGPPTAV